MFNLAEHRLNKKHLADQLIWFGLVAKSIILNKNGSLQRTVQLMGFDLETSSVELLEANCNKLNHIFKQLGSNWALYFDIVRSKSISYPKPTFVDKLALLIDLERKDRFELENNFIESNYYLTFVWLPPRDREVSLAKRFIKQSNDQIKLDREKDLESFKKVTDGLIDSLRFSFLYVESLSDEETLSYLHSLISNTDHVVKTSTRAVYLDYMLSDTSLLGGLEPKLGDRYFKILTIRFFPNSSFPCLLDGLNHLNVEFRWTTRWISLDKDDAMAQIDKKAKNWMSKRISLMKIIGQMFHFTSSAESNNVDAAVNQFDAQDAKLELTDNQVGFGYYTATIIVYDHDLELCQIKLNKIKNFINDKGFVCKEETINAVDAWFGALPGHTHANVRYPLISTNNLSHFISISSAWPGYKSNQHFAKKFQCDAPLMITQTEGNTPFRLNIHQGDVGHTLILGPTGQGKSTLLVVMALQFLRYPNAQVFFFDKGYSSKVATLGLNGKYYQFENNGGLSLQPLSNIDRSADRQWAENWLQSVIEQQGVKLTIEHKKELRGALESLATRAVQYRTLFNLSLSLQERDQKMAMALSKFTESGPYGYLLDGTQGSLANAAWITFELAKLMESNKDAIEPVLTCLFHKLEQRFTGRPTLLILDEAWTYLKNKLFLEKIQTWLRELRKNEVSVIFASQSLADAIDTPLMPLLLESCQTKILLPNKEALNPAISLMYKKIGLNEAQINMISQAIGKKQYFYYASCGVRLFDLTMGELALAICCNAGIEISNQCDEIIAKFGEDKFLEHWLKLKKLEWAANIIKAKNKVKSKELYEICNY